MTTTPTLAVGRYVTAYVVPTLYGKPVTRTATLTEVLVGYTGKTTFIFHGARGGKLVVGGAEIVTAVAA